MGTINLRKMDAAAAELSEEARRLRSVQASLEDLFTKQDMDDIRISADAAGKEDTDKNSAGTGPDYGRDDSGQYDLSASEMENLAEMLRVEANALEKAAAALRRAVQMYRQAEARVLAVYDGELLVVPRTVFGTSHFENLRGYEPLIPVRADILSAANAGQEHSVTADGGQPGLEAGENREMKSLEGIL